MKMKVMMMAMMKKNKTKMIEHDKGCPGRLATAAILTPSTTPKKKEIIMTALMKMINLMRMVIQCNAKQCNLTSHNFFAKDTFASFNIVPNYMWNI